MGTLTYYAVTLLIVTQYTYIFQGLPLHRKEASTITKAYTKLAGLRGTIGMQCIDRC